MCTQPYVQPSWKDIPLDFSGTSSFTEPAGHDVEHSSNIKQCSIACRSSMKPLPVRRTSFLPVGRCLLATVLRLILAQPIQSPLVPNIPLFQTWEVCWCLATLQCSHHHYHLSIAYCPAIYGHGTTNVNQADGPWGSHDDGLLRSFFSNKSTSLLEAARLGDMALGNPSRHWKHHSCIIDTWLEGEPFMPKKAFKTQSGIGPSLTLIPNAFYAADAFYKASWTWSLHEVEAKSMPVR